MTLVFGGYVTSAPTIEAFAIKISRTRRVSHENIAKSEVFLSKYYGTTTTSLSIFDTNLIFFDPSPQVLL